MDQRDSVAGDEDDEAAAPPPAEADELFFVPSDEEEPADAVEEEEIKPPSVRSETLIQKLDLLDAAATAAAAEQDEQGQPLEVKLPNPMRRLDERSHQTREEIRTKFKEAPKTILALAEDKKSNIERQLEKSAYRLQDLVEFGNELVSNVKVANEKREWLRRGDEMKRRQKLDEDLRRESIESMARYDAITARWTELKAMKEPVALFESLQKQKERIAALMHNKDDIIAQCQGEIDRVNARYYADQQQQAADICCLIERVDAQVELMKKAYECNLDMLQETIEQERRSIQLEANKKWQNFYDGMCAHESRKFQISAEKQRFYAEQIESISKQQEEITRATRIRLDKDSEMLEWELRNVKNNVLMNSEKLDYNYQVLQKRNDENIIINMQQKRRVARLNEAIAAMRYKIITSNAKAKQNKQKLVAEIQKLHASISELEQKAHQFERSNRRKFNKVWAMNYREIRTSVEKVLEIDRILHEQQLLMPWQRPDIDLTDINADTAGEAERAKTAPASGAFKRPGTSAKKGPAPLPNIHAKPANTDVRLLRNILRQISDRAGFLVGERLIRILAPYTEEEKRVVRIDNIFNALHINDIESVNSLVKYFLPYAWCPNCTDTVPDRIIRRIYELHSDGESVPEESPFDDDENIDDVESLKSPDCKNHYLVTEPSLVLNALQAFTSAQQAAIGRSRGSTAGADKTAPADAAGNAKSGVQMDGETITQFWAKFRNCLSEDKQKLWNSLEHGLNHYLDVLKQRAELDGECSALERQNKELRHLLQEFDN